MRILKAIACGTALCVVFTACGEEERQTADAGNDITRQAGTLPPYIIDQLAAAYPVLREERAAEPQPNGDPSLSELPQRVRETLPPRVLETVRGEATFYANTFEGRRTASGIPFRQNQLVAAHRAYPFGTLLRVTNLRNDRSVNVRVVDRGPHGATARARNTIIDLSRRAAERLGYISAGRAQVRVEVLEWGKGLPIVS
jgi:rare lipoprotein A